MVETFTIQHPRRAGTAEVVFAADYATAKLEALDCRTCRHLSQAQQACMAAVQCIGGSHYQRHGKLMLWSTIDASGNGA